MLRSHNVETNGDSLQAVTSDVETFAVMLQVPDCSRFEVCFTNISGIVSVGIAPEDLMSTALAGLTEEDIDEKTDDAGVVSLNMCPRDILLYPEATKVPCEFKDPTGLKLRFIDRELFFAPTDGLWFSTNSLLSKDLKPDAVYRPFLFGVTGDLGESKRITNFKISAKRKCADQILARQHKLLWSNRNFTDAVIVCGDRHIPVHRAVLSAASPVFERAFSVSMQEASTRTFQVNECPCDAAVAMIRFIYTGDLKEHESHDDKLPHLLHLATQYELSDLAELAATMMVDRISASNVKEWARTLKLHRSNPHVESPFSTLIDKLQANRDLLILSL